MQTFPPLANQIFEIVDNDPTKKYELDGIISLLKSSPQKREVIKAINALITDKKMLKLEENGKKLYKTTAFVPDNVSKNTDIKIIFISVQNKDDKFLKESEGKTWKKLRIYGCAQLDYTGHGPRSPATEYFRIIHHKFEKSSIQLSWMIQEKINNLNKEDEISILLYGNEKDDLVSISELVINRGFKVNIETDLENVKKWIE